MSFTFKQSSGGIYNTLGDLLEAGYAGGDQGARPDGINNPVMQADHNIGPLPQGLYHIGAAYNHPRLGVFVLPLYPHPENNMFGRSGFFIHGDRMDKIGQRAASDGCIVAAHPTREKINNSDDKELIVVA